MNSDEVLRIVEQIHLERKIDKEIVFVGIEQALVVAARKHGAETSQVIVHIDRQTGEITAFRDGIPLTPREISERIGAQTAKQVMIQKIREAERDAIYDVYNAQIGDLVVGEVHRVDTGATTVVLDSVEAILPRMERIPGEVLHPRDRISAVIVEVKKSGTKVKVILSRSRPIFLQRLFEREVPEVEDGIIEIRGIAREAGHRSKVSVYSTDPRLDGVGTCIGVRRSRIRGILDELGNERVDLVPWDKDLQRFIPNALQPAKIDDVILCSMNGRAVALVQRDERSLAIGKKGQNVRLASKLCGWDIDILTRDELEAVLGKAGDDFLKIDGISPDLADQLVGAGYFSYDELSGIEPVDLMKLGGLTAEETGHILEQVEEFAEQQEMEIEASGSLPLDAEEPVQGGGGREQENDGLNAKQDVSVPKENATLEDEKTLDSADTQKAGREDTDAQQND